VQGDLNRGYYSRTGRTAGREGVKRITRRSQRLGRKMTPIPKKQQKAVMRKRDAGQSEEIRNHRQKNTIGSKKDQKLSEKKRVRKKKEDARNLGNLVRPEKQQ